MKKLLTGIIKGPNPSSRRKASGKGNAPMARMILAAEAEGWRPALGEGRPDAMAAAAEPVLAAVGEPRPDARTAPTEPVLAAAGEPLARAAPRNGEELIYTYYKSEKWLLLSSTSKIIVCDIRVGFV
jgi:hypothetical protein